MKSFVWLAGYLGTSVLGLALAYPLSTYFLAPARAQNGAAPAAPSDGSLPAEFLKEIENNPPSANSPKMKDMKPVPPQNGQAVPVPAPAPANAAKPAPAPSKPEAPPAAAANNAAPAAPAASSPTATSPTPPAATPNAATATGTEDYVYDPTGRRDPFKPYRAIREDRKISRTTSEELEPLQRYDVEQLTIMGILWDVHQPRAIVKDSDGNMHTVVKNTKMGRSNGYVAAIREGEIILIETIDDEGRTLKRTRVMELKK